MMPPLADVVGAAIGLLVFLYAAIVETALVSTSRPRVERLVEHGNGTVRRLHVFVEQPNRFVVAAQVLRILGAVATTAFVAVLTATFWGPAPEAVAVAVLVVFAALTLLQWFPRAVAVEYPERTLTRLYHAIQITTAVMSPIVASLNWLAGLLARPFGLARLPAGPVATADALFSQASAAREAGLIEEAEHHMIESIIEMDKTTAREIMVPRPDVVTLLASATIDEALEVISAHGYSRLPVYEDVIDNIVGVLYAKDLFRHLRAGSGGMPIKDLLRAAYFIPESKRIDEVLRELQKRKVHIAIVIDEYGGTAGIVTIEDLLEEIVGEIQDEYDREEAKIVPVSPDEAIFDATVSIGDVNDTLDLTLESEDVDTIGGLLYERLGKVPTQGDQAELDGALLQVESTVGRRIRKVRVTRRAAETTTLGAA